MNCRALLFVTLQAIAACASAQVFDPVNIWLDNPSLGPLGRGSVSLQFNHFLYDPRVNSFESETQMGSALVTVQSRLNRSFGFGFWYAGGSNTLRQETTGAEVEFDSSFFELHATAFIRMPSLVNTLGVSLGYLQGDLNSGASRSRGRWTVPYLAYSRVLGNPKTSRWIIGASLGFAFSLDKDEAENALNYSLSASYDLDDRFRIVGSYYVLDLQGAAKITRISAGIGYQF